MATERQKMIAGDPYDPFDPELVAARGRAGELCRAINATAEGDLEAQRDLVRALFGTAGDDVWLRPPFYCDYGFNIRVGAHSFFNFNCVVLDVCAVTIGAHTLFGPAVQIYTASHPLDAALRREREYGRPVAIGDDVWVGGGAIICPGVTVGSRAVIGAGSVVTRDVPGDVFAAGNPCAIVRRLDGG